jgi:anti-anti-sigma factor
MNPPPSSDLFTIERHGDLTLISATPALETLDSSLEDPVAQLLMNPLREQVAPLVVFDLTGVNYFGSMFLAVLLKCWKLITSTGGTLVLAGVSQQARELLRITSLDQIWAMYANRREAMEALLSD